MSDKYHLRSAQSAVERIHVAMVAIGLSQMVAAAATQAGVIRRAAPQDRARLEHVVHESLDAAYALADDEAVRAFTPPDLWMGPD